MNSCDILEGIDKIHAVLTAAALYCVLFRGPLQNALLTKKLSLWEERFKKQQRYVSNLERAMDLIRQTDPIFGDKPDKQPPA